MARLAARKRPLTREEERTLAEAAEVFKALCDPTRLKILHALGAGEACVHELCARLGMTQSGASHQLRVLRVQHLVRARRAGREIFYSVADEHVLSLVASARDHAAHLIRGERERR